MVLIVALLGPPMTGQTLLAKAAELPPKPTLESRRATDTAPLKRILLIKNSLPLNITDRHLNDRERC